MDTTAGTLLDGRVRYTQPVEGYRTGIEPVMLAAFVPARDGDRLIEAGSGAGAGLLCLAARVPGLRGQGIEEDPGLAALAARNAHANGYGERLDFRAGRIATLGRETLFDHALANPPWHDAAGTPSPNPGRTLAKQAPAGLLDEWIGALAAVLKPRGTLSLALSAANLDTAIAALTRHGCGSLLLFPLWPRAGREARILLVQAVSGGRAATRLLPGLLLHTDSGYTPEANAVLRAGGKLPGR